MNPLQTMSPKQKAFCVAALHVVLLLSMGGKMLFDRATCPRVWAQTRGYDPYSLLQGRYIALQLTGVAVQQDMATPTTVQNIPVEYFIPEHAIDPSLRNRGEELWIEVTIPRKGAPRPIRLGVKKGGEIKPMEQ